MVKEACKLFPIVLVNQTGDGCSHHASCTHHNEPEIGDLLVKETVNSVTWKCSELLLNTRMLFHTHRWSRRTKKISWLCNWRKIRMMCHKSHPAELSRRHPHCGLLQEDEDLESVNHVHYWILETQYDCSSSMHYW